MDATDAAAGTYPKITPVHIFVPSVHTRHLVLSLVLVTVTR